MLKMFKILHKDSDQTIDGVDYQSLINLEHIVSIKPINIMFQEEVIKGYWIRLSNGKKYKATKIPAELEALFSSTSEVSLRSEIIPPKLGPKDSIRGGGKEELSYH